MVVCHLRDQNPEKRNKFYRALQSPNRYVISTQVIAEVGNNLLKKGKISEPDFRTILESMQRICDIIPVTLETGLYASRLRQSDTLSYWDSLIIAAALESGCTQLWSEDLQDGRVIEKTLTIINPLIERKVPA
jgi:predicted nucleic acid-binding protein